MDTNCCPLTQHFHVVPDVLQSLNSLRENGVHATCNVGVIMEQILQADKQKISRSAHIIIRINKHYSHIIHDDASHPFG
jgi:hypothetical protein